MFLLLAFTAASSSGTCSTSDDCTLAPCQRKAICSEGECAYFISTEESACGAGGKCNAAGACIEPAQSVVSPCRFVYAVYRPHSVDCTLDSYQPKHAHAYFLFQYFFSPILLSTPLQERRASYQPRVQTRDGMIMVRADNGIVMDGKVSFPQGKR